MPRRNCLYRPESTARHTAKCSGAKLGMGGKVTGRSTYRLSPTRSALAFTRPTTSPG